MRTVDVHAAKTQRSKRLAEVEAGRDFIVPRNGGPVARITAIKARPERGAGSWRKHPGGENVIHDPAIFAPVTDGPLKEEGWG